MATLLPSLSSEEEDIKPADEQESDDDDDVNHDFEFGGVLGEDGGWSRPKGWSYQQALDLLEQNDSQAMPRMDIASIIAAKRRDMKKAKKEKHQDDEADGEDSEGDDDNVNNSNGGEDDHDNKDDDGSEDDDSEEESDSEEDQENDVPEPALEADSLKVRVGREDGDEEGDDKHPVGEDDDEARKAAEYFDKHAASQTDEIEVFSQLTLSRPLLRGVAAMGFTKPTPIQAAVIPVALAGRDVCASAQTGSGKTAAFLLPILERISQRASGGTKGLILTPTRELAAQCLGMMTTITQFTKLRACLVVGGAKNVNAQAAELRTRPEVVVATPGRLLDHITNSAGITLDDVEFLVLDECDRLLQLGFQEEVHEIVKACPTERQTLLFSATLTTKVDELVKLSLKRPVRIKISSKDEAGSTEVEVAERLEQEFVRVRAGNEGVNREAMLLALLNRTYTARTIVFFDTKATAHRMMILCGLVGIKCTELHGNLTQMQRLNALEDFRKGDVDVLLATDLAARGLDIDRVQSVINFEMPSQVETYVHRIGRTARRGRAGKSCTLIGEGRRHLMKDVIKDAEEKAKQESAPFGNDVKSGVIRSRTIPAAVVSHFVEKIKSLEPHVEDVLQAEAVARMDRIAEMEATKAQNLIEHADEIKARPKREWFASSTQKQVTKEAAAEKARLIAEKVGTGSHRMTRKKRRARDAKEQLMRYQEEIKEKEAINGNRSKKAFTDEAIKVSARSQKRAHQQKRLSERETSVGDEDGKVLEKEREKKKRKGGFASDAMGDASLFNEERVTHAKKAAKNEADVRPNTYHFNGYDQSKTGKKTKKKSVHKFKSKAKYKRRK